jgi:predicted phosphoadenosine phosphosulfate sulfurtransferase
MEKKQLKVKNYPKNYTTTTLLNEGGIFHVNSIDDNGNMNATYEYVDDIHNNNNDAKKLYILFSCLPKHPNNEN